MILGDAGVLYDVHATGLVRVLLNPHSQPLTTRVWRIQQDVPVASRDDIRRIQDTLDKLRGS